MDVYSSMGMMIEKPWLALIPAALLLWLFSASGNRLALGAGAVWASYCLYEYGMTFRILCSGECNIRIDLFVIYPALILAGLTGLVAAVYTMRTNSHH